jgi:hypothetical protein
VVVFADIDLHTLCLDPDDIEHRITPKTKAIVAVHYAGHPCGARGLLLPLSPLSPPPPLLLLLLPLLLLLLLLLLPPPPAAG